MDEHAAHAECIGDAARMLTTRTTERAQRVAGDVVTALHGDVLDRVRHVLDGDVEESVGDLFRRARAAGAGGDLRGERFELVANDFRVERRIAARPENLGKERRVEFADHYVAIGHRQRPAAAIRRRSRVRTGGLGTNAQARAVERADRTAAGRDRVNTHHRRTQSHAGDFGHERTLVLASPVRDVGRRAPHVEPDDPVEAGEPRHFDGTDDAARRSRQDRVLALEPVRVGEPAGRLHELQPDGFRAIGALWFEAGRTITQ